MLLPKRHHVTDLIILDFHLRNPHSGLVHTLNAVRKRFWIEIGVSTVKRVLHDCIYCRLKKAEVSQQLMAPLPAFRVTPGKLAFSCAGAGYMRSIAVKL